MSTTRTQKRMRLKLAEKHFKLPAGLFKQIDLSQRKHPEWMTRAFMNNRYIVMIDDKAKTDKGVAIKAMIQKLDDSIITNHWSEIQNIKNELFGREATGVEYYPAESKLMNDHNIYWLWIFPDGILPIPIIVS